MFLCIETLGVWGGPVEVEQLCFGTFLVRCLCSFNTEYLFYIYAHVKGCIVDGIPSGSAVAAGDYSFAPAGNPGTSHNPGPRTRMSCCGLLERHSVTLLWRRFVSATVVKALAGCRTWID